MSQLAIYLDEETAALLDKAAEKEGMSRSAWARRAIRSSLSHQLPESFFEVLGKWEDDRSADEIIQEIRSGCREVPRAALD